jgi:hypothetical protein
MDLPNKIRTKTVDETFRKLGRSKQLIIHNNLNFYFNTLDISSERIKERINVKVHDEAYDFNNIDNPRSLLLKTAFSSVRPRFRFHVVVR